MMDQQVTSEHVYCGVVIINAVLGGLNVLLISWLSGNRNRADRHKTEQYATVMKRLDRIEDNCTVMGCRARISEEP